MRDDRQTRTINLGYGKGKKRIERKRVDLKQRMTDGRHTSPWKELVERRVEAESATKGGNDGKEVRRGGEERRGEGEGKRRSRRGGDYGGLRQTQGSCITERRNVNEMKWFLLIRRRSTVGTFWVWVWVIAGCPCSVDIYFLRKNLLIIF